MNRRHFVQTAGAATLGGVLFTSVGCQDVDGEAEPNTALPVPTGLQLYTIRTALQEEFFATIDQIAAIGYEEVEFAGLHGHDPREVRECLDAVGLLAPSAHIDLERLENDFDGVVKEAHILGHTYVIVPWLAEERRQSRDDYRRLADTFNELGERLLAEGLQYGYHNHAFEFERYDGEPGYDILLENTDPKLVMMEMDLYWLVDAGEDPMDYLRRYPGRFPLFHVKDRTADGDMVNVGDGVIPFGELLERGAEDGLRHAFVEHDNPVDPMTTIEASFTYLTSR